MTHDKKAGRGENGEGEFVKKSPVLTEKLVEQVDAHEKRLKGGGFSFAVRDLLRRGLASLGKPEPAPAGAVVILPDLY
jgi:hypothetical protein